MGRTYRNNARGTLASGITNSDLSITLGTGEGAAFGSPSAGSPLRVTLTQATAETSWEIVECTGVSGDTLTLSSRGLEGTAAAAWSSGTKVSARVTAGTLGEFASSTLTISNKTGAYTVVAADNGTIINCTSGTFTVSLTAAATLGAGFQCTIWNTSTTATDVITIDPNASETIDSMATLSLRRGEGLQIVCVGTNWQTGDKKVMRLYAENGQHSGTRPVASGSDSIAQGRQASSTGLLSIAYGYQANAGSNYSTAFGAYSAGGGSVTATGAGAMALGGSYASGTDSFAAAIGNNTSSYGATGANSVADGQLAKASGSNAIARGRNSISSGSHSCTYGVYCTASGDFSTATGYGAVSATLGKHAYAGGFFASYGDAQTGKIVLRRSTTNATPTVVTSDGAAASSTNQIILPNDSTYAFTILVVARRTDANDESAGYEFKGVVDRNGSAATTAIVGSVSKTVLAEDTAAWDCDVTADTTNGGLAITVTGEAGKTIRWVATSWTVEVSG